MGHVSLSRALS